MGDWATVPEDRGILLRRTWRMQPDPTLEEVEQALRLERHGQHGHPCEEGGWRFFLVPSHSNWSPICADFSC